MPEDPTALDFVDDPGEIYQGVWPQAAELRRTGELLRLAVTITCPVVAIHGDYDPHPAEGIQEPLAAHLKDFRMVMLEKCGHNPWSERYAMDTFYELLEAEIGQVKGLSAKHVRVLQLRALRRAALLEAEERSVPVESLSMPYNEQALRVLELTKEEARAFNQNYIGTEHLLLGILREGSAAAELITQGVTFEGMRGGIMFVLGGRPQGIAVSQLDFTPRTQKVLAMAGEEAQRLGETAISPHHLLVAILREGQGIAAQLLQASSVRLEQVGETVHISMIPDTEEGPITLPTDFQEALQQHPAAHTIFERLSYSKKKRFVDRIEQAEGKSARSQQVEKAIELLQQIHQQHQR